MIDNRTAIALISLGASLLGGCSVTTVREHPSLEAQLEQIDKVVIAPPVVNVTLVTFDGDNRRLSEEEDRIREELISIARKKLTEHSFDVVEFDFDQAIEDDNEFAFSVEQVLEGYRQAKKTLYKSQTVSEQDKRKFKASVGEVVNMIADKTGADAVLLVEYNGIKKSKGKIAQEVAAGVLLGVLTGYASAPAPMGTAAEVALVDAWTGDVLWTNIQGSERLDAQAVGLAMDKLPNDIDPVVAQSLSTPSEPTTRKLLSDNLGNGVEGPLPEGLDN